eukprot:6463379-Amphidinium_carterae.1
MDEEKRVDVEKSGSFDLGRVSHPVLRRVRFFFVVNFVVRPYQAVMTAALDPDATWLKADTPQRRVWTRFLEMSPKERQDRKPKKESLSPASLPLYYDSLYYKYQSNAQVHTRHIVWPSRRDRSSRQPCTQKQKLHKQAQIK